MGLTVRIEDEDGRALDEVHDPQEYISRCLPAADDASYQCVKFIDRYGDTCFNQLQMSVFLKEWMRIAHCAETEEAKKVFQSVRTFAQRCKDEPHLYLKFIGD